MIRAINRVLRLLRPGKSPERILEDLTEAYSLGMAIISSWQLPKDEYDELFRAINAIRTQEEAVRTTIKFVNRVLDMALDPVLAKLQPVYGDMSRLSFVEFAQITREQDRLYSGMYLVAKKKADQIIDRVLHDMVKEDMGARGLSGESSLFVVPTSQEEN